MQSENKNDSVQLSSRYQQYLFAKRHLRGTSRPKVFPIGSTNEKTNKTKELPEQISNTIRTNYSNAHSNETYVLADEPNTQETGDKSNDSNAIRRTSYTDDMRIRRLTPTECMRLQGFPDNWCDGISDTQKYKCAGNAVTVNVIQAIIEKLL
jgi:DNA (cytosine-5)-methyltransferase 1